MGTLVFLEVPRGDMVFLEVPRGDTVFLEVPRGDAGVPRVPSWGHVVPRDPLWGRCVPRGPASAGHRAAHPPLSACRGPSGRADADFVQGTCWGSRAPGFAFTVTREPGVCGRLEGTAGLKHQVGGELVRVAVSRRGFWQGLAGDELQGTHVQTLPLESE